MINEFANIAQYDVYVYDDEGECVHDYVGNDLDAARTSFENLKSINSTTPIEKDITVVLYDNWNEKIVEDYNTLRDA